ncbi:MAG: aminotransferase class V-fold PLP-dependent enzyme [Planctomycetaceae bacterium]
MPGLYLDNAATSWPKPECVYDAVDRYSRQNGRAVGRGATDASLELQQTVDRCRQRAAALLGAGSVQEIAFHFNCTDSLNTILHGLLHSGDHVVTSIAEHNSVLRPLRYLERNRGVSVSMVDVNEVGYIEPAAVRSAIRPETKLVIVQHVSNVTGVIQPVADIGEIARQKGALFAIDAAQSAGHIPFLLTDVQPDFLACAGHKGLLGPLGTGLLWIAPGRESDLLPLRQGGTGSRSELDVQPDTMPDRFESGNHNAPGLVGLDAALGFLIECGIQSVKEHEQALASRLCERLQGIRGLVIHSSQNRAEHTGIVSLASEDYASDELAALLNQHFQIDTRAGLHCAPGIHRRLGTLERQGTVRVSFGWSSAAADVDRLVDALQQVSQFA